MNQPARIFGDRNDANCSIIVEQNADKLGPYDMQGGVWFCVKNGNTGAIASVDLTDHDAAEVGQFLTSITARRFTSLGEACTQAK